MIRLEEEIVTYIRTWYIDKEYDFKYDLDELYDKIEIRNEKLADYLIKKRAAKYESFFKYHYKGENYETFYEMVSNLMKQ